MANNINVIRHASINARNGVAARSIWRGVTPSKASRNNGVNSPSSSMAYYIMASYMSRALSVTYVARAPGGLGVARRQRVAWRQLQKTAAKNINQRQPAASM